MIFTECIQLNPPIVFEKGKEYPFIEMANVDFYSRSPKAIDIKPYSSGVKFQKGDTVIARIEPCLQNGKGFFVNELTCGFGSTEFLVFRPKTEDVDNRFLYYYLQTDYIRKSMIASMTGATGRQRVNNKIFDMLDIILPNIETQRRIADILSAYDDLIENNQKQIKLLEEAAMRLYKEWFIHLRFSGYETTKIIDGVPEGWKKKSINDLMTFHRGYDLTKSNMRDGLIPVVGSTSIIGYHNEFKVRGPGIVTGRSGSLGKYQLIWDDFWPHNTSLYICDYKGHDVFFIYCLLQTVDFSLLNSGGAIPTLNRNTLSNIIVLEPNKDLQEKFAVVAKNFYEKILIANKQIYLLRQARDILLPKLINGEIEV